MSEPSKTLHFIFLGESSVGKTSIIRQYVEGTFDSSGTATIGIDFRIKMLKKNNKNTYIRVKEDLKIL